MTGTTQPTDSSAALRAAITALRTARESLTARNRERTEPIAIVGAGCRLPGGVDSLAAYGDFLRAGGDGITDIPAGRWDVDAYFDADPEVPGRFYTRRIGAIAEAGAFDAGYFGISPREAEAMDPQQRLLLEVTQEALDHASIAPELLRDSRTGVFVGICANDYGAAAGDPGGIDIYSATGAATSVAAGRIAYQLGLSGPALAVDTACSSSLVALDLAVRSLRSGDCDLAIVGGVSLIVSPESMIEMSRLRALSPTGRSASFAAAADGYVRGEGAGVLIVKRAADARAAGDRVLASVLATAVDQDGRSNGLTAPNGRAQEAVVRAALERAQLSPARIDYLEAHGTGTPLGDPIELRALQAVFADGRDEPLVVGSVKSNIGHLEAAAGIAGLLKVVTVLRDRVIPANLHFAEPNPLIDWAHAGITVPTRSQPLPADRQLFGGVSSFGFSGTNAHVVLAGPEPVDVPVAPAALDVAAHTSDRRVLALPLSARSAPALHTLADRLRERLVDRPPAEIADICATAARRGVLDERAVVFGETGAALERSLTALAEGRTRAGVIRGRRAADPGPLVFVYSGLGADRAGMGSQLMAEYPVFRTAVEHCAAELIPRLGVDIAAALATGAGFEDRPDLELAQGFAFRTGLTALLDSLGIRPDLVIGHGVGEVAAAHAAGALSAPDAAAVLSGYGRALRSIAGTGALLSIRLGVDRLGEWLARAGGAVDIAAVEGPAQVLVSGSAEVLDRLHKELTAAGQHAVVLTSAVAAHSRALDPQLAACAAAIGTIGPVDGTTALLSGIDADYRAGHTLDTAYWLRALRSTVRFDDAVARVLRDGPATFLEVGPDPTLIDALTERLEAGDEPAGVALTTLRHHGYARRELVALAARLHVRGIAVDWTAIGGTGAVVDLPGYPWEHKHYWAASDWDAGAGRSGGQVSLESSTGGERIVQRIVDTARSSWLLDHAFGGRPVVPGAWFVDFAAVVQREQQGDTAVEVIGIAFDDALPLAPDSRYPVQLVLRDGEFRVSSRRPGDGGWTQHVRGRVRPAAVTEPARLDLDAIRAESKRELSAAALYADYRSRGMHYDSAFQGVTEVWVGAGTALGRIRTTGAGRGPEAGPLPAPLLDSCFQVVGALAEPGELFVPRRIESVTVLAPMPGEVYSYVHNYRRDGARQIADLDIVDPQGRPIAVVRALTAEQQDDSATGMALFEEVWQDVPAVTVTGPAGHWVVAGPDAGDVAAFADLLTAAGATCDTTITGGSPDRSALESGTVSAGSVYLAGAKDFGDLAALLHIAQRPTGPGPSTRLWIVTRGGRAVTGDEPVDPWQSALWGFGTALTAEHPELRTTLIDIVGADDLPAVVTELSGGPERHIALRSGRRYLARIENATLPTDSVVRTAAAQRAFAAIGHDAGTPVLRARPVPVPAPHQVVIAVAAAGADRADPAIGIHCAGTISAVGTGVSGVALGDAVIALAPGCLGTHAVADARLVHPLPGTVPLRGAAGQPLAYGTAAYALEYLARMVAGQCLLVHGAGTATGIAVIETARALGVRIFATAAGRGGRNTLRVRDIEHVFDSDTAEFADAVLELTEGRGVDVVFDASSGTQPAAVLRSLATDGILLDSSSASAGVRGRLSGEIVDRRIAYVRVDLTGVLVDHPERVAGVFGPAMDRLIAGRVPLLRVIERPISDLADPRTRPSDRERSYAETVFHTTDAATTEIEVPAGPGAAESGWQVISGGLGGLGMALAGWLIRRGARQLALLVRREPDAAAHRQIDEWRAAGAEVVVELADIADSDQVGAALRRLRVRGSVRGVFHLAGVLRDGVVANQSWAQFEEVLRPKAIGAWNLHRATLGDALDHFVLYSSTAALLPSGGQSNYAAANAFLDGLAHYRHSRGLPATAIAWGPFGDAGLAAGNPDAARYLAGRGIRAGETAAAQELLATSAATDRATFAAIALDTGRWRAAHPFAAAVPLYTAFGGGDTAGATMDVGPSLRDLPAAERDHELLRLVTSQLAQVLQTDGAEIADHIPFLELGVSSLALLEFKNGVAAAVGLELPGAVHWEYPTVRALHRYLAGRFREEGPSR